MLIPRCLFPAHVLKAAKLNRVPDFNTWLFNCKKKSPFLSLSVLYIVVEVWVFLNYVLDFDHGNGFSKYPSSKLDLTYLCFYGISLCFIQTQVIK